MMKKNAIFQCPECLSSEVETVDYYFDETVLELVCSCPRCDKTWTELATIEYKGFINDKRLYDKEGDLVDDLEDVV